MKGAGVTALLNPVRGPRRRRKSIEFGARIGSSIGRDGRGKDASKWEEERGERTEAQRTEPKERRKPNRERRSVARQPAPRTLLRSRESPG